MVEGLRPILNFTQGQTLTPRGEVDPRSELCPLGVKLFPGVRFSVRPFILLNSRVFTPWAVNEGVNITLREQISPLGATGEVKNGPLLYKLAPMGGQARPLHPSSPEEGVFTTKAV
jgi:hypothetical protein